MSSAQCQRRTAVLSLLVCGWTSTFFLIKCSLSAPYCSPTTVFVRVVCLSDGSLCNYRTPYDSHWIRIGLLPTWLSSEMHCAVSAPLLPLRLWSNFDPTLWGTVCGEPQAEFTRKRTCDCQSFVLVRVASKKRIHFPQWIAEVGGSAWGGNRYDIWPCSSFGVVKAEYLLLLVARKMDLQAHSVQPCDTLWACRSAILKSYFRHLKYILM